MAASKTLTEFQLHDLQLSNRVVMAPMTRGRAAAGGVPADIAVEYYKQRASAGLILTEGAAISEQAEGWVGAPGIYTDEQEAGWKKVVDAVHAEGGKIFLQLWHTGRAGHSSFHNGELPVSASAVPLTGDGIHTPKGKEPYDAAPRALDIAEIPGVVEQYHRAAERAKSAGFDGVEIHGANGYLVDQFLQSKTNHRTDEYGGSIENRYRFLDDIVKALLTVYSSNRIAVRLSPNGVYNGMGSPDFREQFTYVIKELNKYNLAFLDLVDGLGFGFHQLGDPFTLKDARAVWTGLLSANCGYTWEQGSELVESGAADLIVFGRSFLANPDFVNRVRNGHPLADVPPFTVFYSPGPEGYIDFPNYTPN